MYDSPATSPSTGGVPYPSCIGVVRKQERTLGNTETHLVEYGHGICLVQAGIVPGHGSPILCASLFLCSVRRNGATAIAVLLYSMLCAVCCYQLKQKRDVLILGTLNTLPIFSV